MWLTRRSVIDLFCFTPSPCPSGRLGTEKMHSRYDDTVNRQREDREHDAAAISAVGHGLIARDFGPSRTRRGHVMVVVRENRSFRPKFPSTHVMVSRPKIDGGIPPNITTDPKGLFRFFAAAEQREGENTTMEEEGNIR